MEGRRRRALVLAAAAAAVLAAAGLAAGSAGPRNWEVDVAREVAGWPSWVTPGLEAVMQLGNRGVALLAAVAVAVAAGRRAGLVTAGSALGAWALTAALKPLVDRPRPALASLGIPVRRVVDEPGFPSSHAAVSAALVTAVILLLRPSRVAVAVLVLAAALTALARIHLGVHWPLDVVGGAAAGALAAGVAVAAGASRRRGGRR